MPRRAWRPYELRKRRSKIVGGATGRARLPGSSRFTAPPPAKAPAEAAGPPWQARPGRCLPALPNPQQKWSRLQSATHRVPRPFIVTPSALLSSVLLSSLFDDLRAIGWARVASLTPCPFPLRRCPANGRASPAGSQQRSLCAVAASHGGRSAETAPEN